MLKLYWSTIYSVQRCTIEDRSVIALGGIRSKTQVGDMGIDSRIFPVTAAPSKTAAPKGKTPAFDEFLDHGIRFRSSRRTR